MTARTVSHVACTFCGCVCDDIELELADDRIVKARRACNLGSAWFLHHAQAGGDPAALVGGEPVGLEEALDEAARCLAGARCPLIYGLSNTTTEAQRACLHLADLIGASIDTTSSVCHGPTEIALQTVGKVSATLGEVKNRADLVVFWGANPAESHPRHFTRYSLTPKGRWVPRGRKDRYAVLIDVRRTPSARAVDQFIQVRPGSDFELINALRALLRGGEVDAVRVEAATGVPLSIAAELAGRMRQARFVALFFGMGLTMTRGKHLNSIAILALAQDVTRHTRCVAIPNRGHGNVSGADTVLTGLTGYPFAVDFSRGYPRYNPGEYSAVDRLVRGEADSALIIASDPGANLPGAAREHLARIPTISLDTRVNVTARLARVHITTAPYGISAGGTVYRMDDIPITLRPTVPSPFPSDEAVLAELIRRVRGLRRGIGRTAD